MVEPKFTSVFSSKVKTIYPEDKDVYIAQASLAELANYLPDIDLSKNDDVLPVAFDAFVANRANKNDDLVDSKTAVALAPLFKNKFINIEHNRDRVIGVILDYKFTEFGSDLPLTEEQVLKMEKPFNVALCGIVWKSVAPELAAYIEEASDPTSAAYLDVSASWEIGFVDFALAMIEKGKKNLEDGLIIRSEEDEYEKMKVHLRAMGGDGCADGENYLYRKIEGEELWGLGVGFTSNPAADVRGIATEKSDMTEKEESEAEFQDELDEAVAKEIDLKPTEEMAAAAKKGLEWRKEYNRGGTEVGVARARDISNRKNLSPSTVKRMKSFFARHEIDKKAEGFKPGEKGYPSAGRVAWSLWGSDAGKSWANRKVDEMEQAKASLEEKNNKKDEKNAVSETKATEKTVNKIRKVMKLKTWKDLTDENIQEVAASDIRSLVEDALKKANAEHQSELKTSQDALELAKQAKEQAETKATEVSERLGKVEAEFDKLNGEKRAAEAQAKFDQRMANLAEKYEFDSDTSEIVARQIKDLDDEAYTKWETEATVLLKSYVKESKAKKVDLDDAIDGGKKDKTTAAASATTPTEEPSLKEQFKSAFVGKIKIN